MKTKVRGWGVNSKHTYSTRDNSGMKPSPTYTIWTGMIRRCHDNKLQEKQPTYIGCSISEDWRDFQDFAVWCETQVGFGNKRWQLDKDLLVPGNKIYCPELCVFLPHELNSLLTSRKAKRGDCPVGVRFHHKHGKYYAGGNAFKYIGFFETEEEAFQAYKIAKENHITKVANKYKEQIDERAYKSLLTYKINIDD